MGTAVSLTIADPLDEPALRDLTTDVFDWLHDVDRRFSTYRADSEVSRLDRGELPEVERSADLRHVLDECGRLWRETDGWFDAYATGRFDPSGYVKGWSVQVASDLLVRGGAGNHCLNAGGDICARGTAGPDRPWRVGILHPAHPDRLAWVLQPTDAAVATSGTYERGLHVINPYTGQGAADLASVTVVGPNLALADAYATAALAMGLHGIDWLAALPGHTSAVITRDGRSYGSSDLPLAPAADRPSAPDAAVAAHGLGGEPAPTAHPLRSYPGRKGSPVGT